MKSDDKQKQKLVLCRFCRSEVAEDAVKCRYCHEWLSDAAVKKPGNESISESQVEQQNKAVGINGSATKEELPSASFQSRMAAKFAKISYWVFYLSCSMLLYFAIAIYWTFGEEDRVFLVSFFLNAMQMFFSAAGIVWFEKLLDRFRFEIPAITGWSMAKSEEYYLEARKSVFSAPLPIAIGFIICTVAVLGDKYIIGTPFQSSGGELAYLIYEFCFLFWSASAIVYFIKFAMFIREFGDLDLRIVVIQEEDSGIHLLGKFILQTALFAVIPYICSITARHIGGWNFGSLLALWFSLFGVAILFYLFWPIYNIHRAMVREKDRKLNLLSHELNELLSGNRLDQDKIHKLRNLLEIRMHLHETNTWPFDMNKVIGLLSAVLIPMASIMIDRYLSK